MPIGDSDAERRIGATRLAADLLEKTIPKSDLVKFFMQLVSASTPVDRNHLRSRLISDLDVHLRSRLGHLAQMEQALTKSKVNEPESGETGVSPIAAIPRESYFHTPFAQQDWVEAVSRMLGEGSLEDYKTPRLVDMFCELQEFSNHLPVPDPSLTTKSNLIEYCRVGLRNLLGKKYVPLKAGLSPAFYRRIMTEGMKGLRRKNGDYTTAGSVLFYLLGFKLFHASVVDLRTYDSDKGLKDPNWVSHGGARLRDMGFVHIEHKHSRHTLYQISDAYLTEDKRLERRRNLQMQQVLDLGQAEETTTSGA